jgi:hypothetical protein
MLYFDLHMRKLIRPVVILGISLIIALSAAAVTYTAKIASKGYSTTASILLQDTPTPQVEEDRSEVGSTDLIVVMGGIITFIVLVPVLAQRKAWMQKAE